MENRKTEYKAGFFAPARNLLLAFAVLFAPSQMLAQEVTPDNIASIAAACYEAAGTAEGKRACVGAEQPACQAWLKAADPAYAEVPTEAVRLCAGVEFSFWEGAVDREWGYAMGVLDALDVSLLETVPDSPPSYFVRPRLEESQRLWRGYVEEFCSATSISATISRRVETINPDCRLAKYGARAAELWQLGAMFE